MLHAYQAKLNLKFSKLIVFATMLIGQAIKGLHSDGLGEFFIGQIIKFVIVGPHFRFDLNDFVSKVLQFHTTRCIHSLIFKLFFFSFSRGVTVRTFFSGYSP